MSESSSLSSSPCEGTERLTKAAAASIPNHTPSLKAKSERNRAIASSLPKHTMGMTQTRIVREARTRPCGKAGVSRRSVEVPSTA
jgi:hypothetical protein